MVQRKHGLSSTKKILSYWKCSQHYCLSAWGIWVYSCHLVVMLEKWCKPEMSDSARCLSKFLFIFGACGSELSADRTWAICSKKTRKIICWALASQKRLWKGGTGLISKRRWLRIRPAQRILFIPFMFSNKQNAYFIWNELWGMIVECSDELHIFFPY